MRVCAYLLVLALAAFVLFEALLRLYSRVGLRIQFHQIEGYIEKAMRAGANGTRFLLRAPRRRIEFLKLVPRAAPTRFLMIVSSNHCSREQFFQARQRLQEAGISFQAVTSIHRTSRRRKTGQSRCRGRDSPAAEEVPLPRTSPYRGPASPYRGP